MTRGLDFCALQEKSKEAWNGVGGGECYSSVGLKAALKQKIIIRVHTYLFWLSMYD